MTKKRKKRDPIGAAAKRLGRAELELAAALADLPNIERADKKIVTARMRRALDEIVAAKTELSTLAAPPAAEDGDAPEDDDDDAPEDDDDRPGEPEP